MLHADSVRQELTVLGSINQEVLASQEADSQWILRVNASEPVARPRHPARARRLHVDHAPPSRQTLGSSLCYIYICVYIYIYI